MDQNGSRADRLRGAKGPLQGIPEKTGAEFPPLKRSIDGEATDDGEGNRVGYSLPDSCN